jgi:exopolysaccharide production protein ExoQ
VAFRIFERLFVVVFLLLSMQVSIGLTRPSESELNPQDVMAPVHVLDTSIEAGVDAMGLVLIALRWRRVVHAARAVLPLIGLVALAVLSTSWSAQPMLTMRRSALLLVATLFAIYIGERYTLEKQVELLTDVFCGMISAILILYFIAPKYVIDYVSHPGAWKGLSAYKNAFGQYMAIAVVLLLLVRFRRFRWLRYAFLVAAASLLFLSQSAASLFSCVLLVAALPFLRSVQLRGRQRWALCAIAGTVQFAGMWLLVANSEAVLRLLGRTSTLTGRTQLWAAVWDAVVKHPILGYGFDAFWDTVKGEAVDVRMIIGWPAQRADNGFLDLGLSLGVVGICLFLLVFALSFRRAIQHLTSNRQPLGLWPIAYLCLFLLLGVAESTLLTRGSLPSLLFAMMTTSLALNRGRVGVARFVPDFDDQPEWLGHATSA